MLMSHRLMIYSHSSFGHLIDNSMTSRLIGMFGFSPSVIRLLHNGQFDV